MLQNQTLTVKPLEGKEIPKFPNYRKKFTSYSAVNRISQDAPARGVGYYIAEMTPTRASGYIVVDDPTVEYAEDFEKIGTWVSEPAE